MCLRILCVITYEFVCVCVGGWVGVCVCVCVCVCVYVYVISGSFLWYIPSWAEDNTQATARNSAAVMIATRMALTTLKTKTVCCLQSGFLSKDVIYLRDLCYLLQSSDFYCIYCVVLTKAGQPCYFTGKLGCFYVKHPK